VKLAVFWCSENSGCCGRGFGSLQREGICVFTGAMLLSVGLLDIFWMWKEIILSAWPFSTASAALPAISVENTYITLIGVF
jgi:hypothetical protein